MAEELIFNARINTGNSAKNIQDIKDELEEVANVGDTIGDKVGKKLTDLNAKIEAGGMTVRQYSKAVKEYQSIALEAGRTSPVGEEALRRAGQLQDELGDLRNEVSRLGQDGRNLQTALQIGSTITAGYSAVQGVMALTGVESEKLQETMVTLQGATSVLNGLEQIRLALEKESLVMIKAKEISTKAMTAAQYAYTVATGTTTGAMKALRVAMLAVPIVAIIAGIAALVGWMSTMQEDVKTTEEAYDDLTASIDRNNKALDRAQNKLRQASDNQIALAKSTNASAEEVHKLELKRIEVEELARKTSLSATEKQLKDRKKAYDEYAKQGKFDKAKEVATEIQADRDKIRQLQDQENQWRVDQQILNNEFANEQRQKREQQNKEASESAKKAAEDRARIAEEGRRKQEEEAQKQLELERTIIDLSLSYMKEGEEKKRLELKVQQDRERQELINKYGQDTELIKQLDIKQQAETTALTDQLRAEQETKQKEEEAKKLELANEEKKTLLEAKLIAMRDDFEAEMALKEELALLEYEQAIAQTDATEAQKLKLFQEYNQKLDAVQDERAAKEQQTNEAIAKSRQALAGAVADVFGKLAGLAKEGSKAQKAFALTELAINTGIGFVNGLRIAQQSAIATGPGAAFAFPIFAAQQVAAVLSAVNSAKKILGASTSVSAPSMGTTGGSGSFNQSNNAATQNEIPGTQNQSTAGLQDNFVKVYIPDSDIIEAANKYEKVRTVSTIL